MSSYVRFRPLERSDLELLGRWFAEAHVSERFEHSPTALADLEAKYGPRIDGIEPTRVFVVLLNQEPIGMVQWTPAEDHAWWPAELGLEDAVAADGYLGNPTLLGRGLAQVIIATFLTERPGGFLGRTRVLGETARSNVPMRRSLERSGFRCVYEGDLVRDSKPDRAVYVREL